MRKKLVKWCKRIVWTILALILIDAGVVFGYAVLEPRVEKADAIIIMGAAINTPALYNRTTHALELYESDMAPVLVLTGGRISSRYISEAQYMQRVLDNQAIKPLNLILDEQAANTYENLRNAKEILGEGKKIIIVSDKYHLARSFFMAKALGFEKVYFSAPDGEYYQGRDWTYYYMREMAGMVAYLPKFLLRR